MHMCMYMYMFEPTYTHTYIYRYVCIYITKITKFKGYTNSKNYVLFSVISPVSLFLLLENITNERKSYCVHIGKF